MAAGAVVAALVIASSPAPASHEQTSTQASRNVLRALATTTGGSAAAARKALDRLTSTIPAADQPSCATSTDPSFKTPAAQFPNGQHGLGVPFVAALTKGEILSGYHVGASVGPKGHTTKWGLTLVGITGWVTGLLEVPSLKADVNQTTGIMFCDDHSYVPTGLASQTPPRLQFTLLTDPSPAANTQNFDPTRKAGGAYAADFFTLKAVSPPELDVTGVEPDGAIDLSGATAATTTVAVWVAENEKPPYDYTQLQTCVQNSGTVIKIGTKTTPEPATAPPGATPQFTGAALTGGFPSAENPTPASATLVGNDFPVAAFPLFDPTAPPTSPKRGCGFASVLDGGLSGFDKNGESNYITDYCKTSSSGALVDCPKIASPPGWSQFTVKATITTLDLPYGTTGLGS